MKSKRSAFLRRYEASQRLRFERPHWLVSILLWALGLWGAAGWIFMVLVFCWWLVSLL